MSLKLHSQLYYQNKTYYYRDQSNILKQINNKFFYLFIQQKIINIKNTGGEIDTYESKYLLIIDISHVQI